MVNEFGLGNISTKGQEIYDTKLKQILEPAHNGEFVAIDVDTGEYFINNDSVQVALSAKEKYPNKIFYLVKVGFPGVFKINSFIPFASAFSL